MEEPTFSTNIQHEHKEGTLEESLRETYGGEAFTMPVDYDTDRFDLSAAYNDPDFQLYPVHDSRFADNNTAVTLPYPVSISALTAVLVRTRRPVSMRHHRAIRPITSRVCSPTSFRRKRGSP